MQKLDDPKNQWARRQAAKHTTPESIRQRIAYEQEQIRILTRAGLGDEPVAAALEAHYQLIRILTERLANSR
jgi:hypothetical protein